MAMTIYHNPRCSKSRKTLEILQNRGVEPTIVEYLKTPPAAATIVKLAEQLQLTVADLVRTGETEFRQATDLPSLDDAAALAAWIARNPKVLQRPIVVDSDTGRAVLGRPPENAIELLGS